MTKKESRRGGHFGIGIERGKTPANVGTLWRTAHCLGANYVFLIGHRFYRECSDVTHSWVHLAAFSYSDVTDFQEHRPYDVPLVGVELTDDATPLEKFQHPRSAMYVVGPEDGSLSTQLQNECQYIVKIDSQYCLNQAVAGSIVLYDRQMKRTRRWKE